MFSVDLPCPGTRANVVIVKTDLEHNRGGLDEVRNDGDCPLFVGALDRDGALLTDVEVPPGSVLGHFQPPEDAASIYAVCHSECASRAVLVYDDPDLVA